jgi:hypothetical protein
MIEQSEQDMIGRALDKMMPGAIDTEKALRENGMWGDE